MARKVSEKERIRARERAHAHYLRTGGTSQAAYVAKCMRVSVLYNPDVDADLIALYNKKDPVAGQTKKLLRELIELRERVK